MNDLKALLRHDVQLLVSVEDQIIAALPAMIERACNPSLKETMEQHLKITEQQRERINQVRNLNGADKNFVKKYSGVLANLMRGIQMQGIAGIVGEGQKVMSENISDEVLELPLLVDVKR